MDLNGNLHATDEGRHVGTVGLLDGAFEGKFGHAWLSRESFVNLHLAAAMSFALALPVFATKGRFVGKITQPN